MSEVGSISRAEALVASPRGACFTFPTAGHPSLKVSYSNTKIGPATNLVW